MMSLASSTDSLEATTEALLSELETVMELQEVAVSQLETLVREERVALVGLEPLSLLEINQRVESVLGKLGQLEATRMHLSVRLIGRVEGIEELSILTAAGELDPPAAARLLDHRHRILGIIARIAQMNEANEHLLSGLGRISRVAVERLSQLQEVASLAAPLRERGDSTGPRAVSLDFRA